jgi:hypothetical protein
MPSAIFLLAFSASIATQPGNPPPTEAFEAPKYGLTTRIPRDWPIAVREEDDRIFVAMIPQKEFDRPGVAACELSLAPESLDDYRSRIDANARRDSRPSGKLASNRLVKGPGGNWLETLWEFHPSSGGFWREVSVRKIANRQLYTFILNVEDSVYAQARPAFDALVESTRLSPPNTGADLLSPTENRWIQREYRFSLELPADWSPVLAPSQVALLFANGRPHGVWSDNLLVLAHPHRDTDLNELARDLPGQLRQEDPACEVISCKVIAQGKAQALETVVRARRGPFSMTVIERRFRGDRLDYEVKYTLESKRFDQLVPKLRKSFESFKEHPGLVPGAGKNKAA